MSDATALRIAIALVSGMALMFARDCVTDAHAQDRNLAVERCLVAEAPPGPDYPAILAVLSTRSSSLEWAALHYCALWVTRRPSARQRSIRLLPGGPSSRVYARHWRAAQEAVAAWERGERPACHPDHFGDRLGDAARARRAGWEREDCGTTANIFFVVPRRVLRAATARARRRTEVTR